MEELSTQQQTLIRYLYNETSLSEEITLKNTMATNVAVREEYNSLKRSKEALPKVLFNPSFSALDNIMKYSRSTATEHYC